ncbi:hypothetical protein CTA2_1902 [Colletotrichum tanaceti]|uniref:Uncharacterized protein n=1 Tax=Colletotrichum tanaceti TaxID=1306861 RepID=A0A4U6X6J8_9PEZI|nr:hypothetical protein CTA2_1902 [Colletotrichum tanaceti]TKW51058.1 hypothetical protein CTA1_9459 [Colletotrichum tanaceti]
MNLLFFIITLPLFTLLPLLITSKTAMRFSTSALAGAVFFAFFANADYHDSCTCHNGGMYNWRLTTKACETEATLLAKRTRWGTVKYDTPSGRCKSVGVSDLIAGEEFTALCKALASQVGFPCAFDNSATCFADPDDVSSWC